MVSLRIRLPYATADEFVEKYGSNVARGGIFIATRSIKPQGTALAFEFVLAGGTRLFRGEGVVVKTLVDEGGQRSGMTVRFQRLDAPSKALVDRVVAARTGVEPAPPEAAPSPPEQEPAARASVARLVPPTAAEPPPEPTPEPPPADAAADGRATGDDPERAVETRPTGRARSERRRTDLDAMSAGRAPPKGPSEVVLGIDLGTTNSRVAIFQGGEARLVALGGDGRTLAMPSVVAQDDKGRFLVGARAKAMVVADPANTVFGAKRLLGRRARSRRIRELARHFPYAVEADATGDAGVNLRGEVHALPALFGLILKELKQAAQETLGEEVRRAVLCVPAYFNDHQRSAMREAGAQAGLEVVRIFNEPSAVALAFGYGKGLARKRVLIYDLGGGTFDASVVEVTGDDLEVISTGGDNFLGGMDFDARVADELGRSLGDAAGQVAEGIPAQRIRDAAEQAKIALSAVERVPVHVPFASTGPDGAPLDLRTELGRARLEELTADLVERTIEVTSAVVESAGLTPQAIDEVILVGGQSQAPLVRRRVEEALGKQVRTDVDAQNAVAVGAAILGHAILQRERGKAGVTLSEVLSAPVGFMVKGGGFRRVLEKNNRLPAEKTVTVPAREHQAVTLSVFQGVAAQAEDNEYLGSLTAEGNRTGEVQVRFAVSSDGTLEVSATSTTGRKLVAAMSTADASDEARAALYASAPLPGEPDAQGAGLLGGIRKLFTRRGAS